MKSGITRMVLNATEDTPSVIIDEEEGRIEFSGKSSPENAEAFYDPVFRLLSYMQPRTQSVNVVFKLDYFNTSSAKCLFRICRLVGLLSTRGISVNIMWHHDDHNMRDMGEDFANMASLTFSYYSAV